MSTRVDRQELPQNFFKITLFSRSVVIIIQLIFNHLVPDHQSDAFKSPYEKISQNATAFDAVIEFTLGGFIRWDAQYFLHIATLGYTHENTLAFFPLFPILLRFQTFILRCLVNVNIWNASLLCSVCTNSLVFSLAARFLFLVTVKLTSDRNLANRTWLLFCMSPLTVFFTAPYSESIFSLLSFGGFYYCSKGQYLYASLFFGCSSAARSNGLLNVGFLGFHFLAIVSKSKLRHIPLLSLKFTLLFIISILPFIFFQLYGYQEFCHVHDVDIPVPVRNFLLSQDLVIAGTKIPDWCYKLLPVSYSAIQSTYWDVGFLHYFQVKQIPNFLLAAPILFLVGLYSFTFFKATCTVSVKGKGSPLFSWKFLPFALHSLFLAFFCFFNAHVQISTRLLGSSSPVVYWIMASLTESNLGYGEEWNLLLKPWKLKGNKLGKLICFYCISYVLIGIVLFSNHLPWT